MTTEPSRNVPAQQCRGVPGAANCQAGSGMLGWQSFWQGEQRQGWRGRVGRAPTALALAWAGGSAPGWSKCPWPFVRICVFFMRWGVSSQMEEAIWKSEPFRLF